MGPEENNDGKRILSFWCPFFHRSFLLIFSGLNHFPNKRGSKPSSSTLPSHRAWKAQILLRLSSIEAANDQDDATLQVRQGLVVWSGCFVLLLGGVFFHFEKKKYKWILLGISSGCFRRYVFNFYVLSTTQWLGGFFWCMGFPYKFPFIGVLGRFLELSTYTEGPNIFGEHI